METWYRTGGYGKDLIEAVTIVKSTEKMVVVREMDSRGREHDSRLAIMSRYYCHFRTWEEAHAHLLESAALSVTRLRLALEKANGHLGNVRGLKKPH